MTTAETNATPDTQAIIAKEIAGAPAPAAPPQEQAPRPTAEREGPTAFSRHRYNCTCDWCNMWVATVTPETSAQYALPVGTVLNKRTKEVLWSVEEIAQQKERERAAGSSSVAAPKKTVLTPKEQALEAVKAGANEVDAAVMDPVAVKALLSMGRPVLIGALEALVKTERSGTKERAQALREAAQKKYEDDLKKAEEENAPYLARIAELEEELEPLQAQVEELCEQIMDMRSLLTVVEPPEDPKAGKKSAAKPQGDGTRRERRMDGVDYPDQKYKYDPLYQTWKAYNRRFPDAKEKQRDLTRVAKAHGIAAKSLDEITDDRLDLLAAYMMEDND